MKRILKFIIIIAGVVCVAWFVRGDYSSASLPDGSACVSDDDCTDGSMCYSNVCRSIFACKPKLNAAWSSADTPDLNGKFMVRNPEYVSMVSVSGSSEYAVRFSGGLPEVHTYERVLLKNFLSPRKVWGGTMMVNFSNIVYSSASGNVVFLGGYTDAQWPEDGYWLRDLTVNASRQDYNYEEPKRFLKALGHYHNTAGGATYFSLHPAGAPNQWPNSFLPVQWYFTQLNRLYVRIDTGPWVRVLTFENGPEENRWFTGFAFGWVSSDSGGSVDVSGVSIHEMCYQ